MNFFKKRVHDGSLITRTDVSHVEWDWGTIFACIFWGSVILFLLSSCTG